MLKEQFGDRVLEAATYLGQNFFSVKSDTAVPVLDFLKLEAEFDYLVDVTAVDYPDKPERFEIIYILYSFARNERIRVKTRVPLGARPESSVSVYPTADWLEREVFDMFGIEFAGHPNMKRILLPDEWQGHPLRKDYGIIQMDNAWVKEYVGIESGQ
jgi:NADH-quinone oxidoreductase subunit C